LLSDEAYAEFARAYGLDAAPNFEGEAWHLVRDPDVPESNQLEKSRVLLREAREPRIHPTLDPKQLTSWNALMAAGLLRAARALGRDDWAALARGTLDFIRAQQWDGSRLLAVHNQGESRFSGYLDDYAFTLCALLESLQTDWRRQDLDFAIHLADALLLRFEDGDHGGFYFSDADQPTPIARSIVTQDDATPAAYALAANSLRQLAALIGEVRYMQAADRALSRARPDLERGPMAFAGIVRSLMQARSPIPQVVISGREPTRAEELKNWVQSRYSVSCYQLRATEAETTHGKQDRPLPGLLAEFRTDQAVSAWVCLGMQCLPPAHTQEDLKKRLDG
jgi:uncharacterized protein YyaL (SSP411 family)